jgi:RNA polymerase sigma factor (sigma-70 family)
MAMLPAQAPPEEGSVHQIRPPLGGGPFRGLAGRSDERLVSIAKEGDERAFETLYERHSPAILRYCRSLLRSTQEAEDVKQEVFVLAISALRRGAEPDAFRPWLYRVAHNACMSHLRARRPVLVADNGTLVGPAAAVEPVDGHREELRQLLDDIGKLPDVQRGALLLREMDGFSYEQVGEVLGLSLSTVRASIFRARRTLQGLAEARDADCEEIQSELCRLADRRGRRGRHITSHLDVCSSCRDFRDGLRRRASVLGGVTPVSPLGPGSLLLALKGKLFGGAAGGGGGATVATSAGGGAGAAKIAAVAASSIALLAAAGVEADRAIEHGRRDAAATPRQVPAPRMAAVAARDTAGVSARRDAATGITISPVDAPRDGGLLATAGHRTSSASRVRAHARVKTSSDAPAAGAHATTPDVGRDGARPAQVSPSRADDGHASSDGAERAEHRGTSSGRDRHHGSGERSDGASGTSGSGSGSGRPGSERADETSEDSRGGSDEKGTSNRPVTRDSPAPTPPATDSSSGTSSPAPQTGGPPPGPVPSDGPSPAPDPAPAPDPPSDPDPMDPAAAPDASADPPPGEAGIATVPGDATAPTAP